MKIALVSPYDFAYPGGVVHHITCLEKYLSAMGHKVVIISPSSQKINKYGHRFIAIGKPIPVPSNGSVSRVTLYPWFSRHLKGLLEVEKFDIIHLHEPLMPTLCSTMLQLSNTYTVGTFHAASGLPGYNWGWLLSRAVARKWSRRLNGRIAVSESALKNVNRYFPDKYTLIPNGIDLEHFQPNVAPLEKYCDGKSNLLYVGRLEIRKGVKYLIKAFQIIKKEIPESRLIIAGPESRYRLKLERYANELGLMDIVFTGYVPFNDLPRYYRTAQVFCAPATQSESFGITLLEAMAMGKPIVASNIEGYADLVGHGSEGLLVSPKDSVNLAQALITVMSDNILKSQMGNKGRAKALNYSWQNIAQKIADYYDQIIHLG